MLIDTERYVIQGRSQLLILLDNWYEHYDALRQLAHAEHELHVH